MVDPAQTGGATKPATPRRGPSSWTLRATLILTMAVLGAAAVLHLVRYVLLIVNRDTLLHPVVAGAATWLSVLASVAAMFAVVGCAYVLTGWLVARREAAFGHRGQRDPRPLWALRAGCLVPPVNLAWAPVYVIELAFAEDRYGRVRRLIWTWWGLFAASTAVSVFASATSFTSDPQGIADNTVRFIVAYLLALAAVVVVTQLVSAFERVPVERPAHRWLAVTQDPESRAETPAAVEPDGEEPAA
jgi:hypothetical protein